MRALKALRKYIEKHPGDEEARTLAELVLALESESIFDVRRLYGLGHERFELALKVLEEWRLDRYFASKGKLFDVSFSVVRPDEADAAGAAPASGAATPAAVSTPAPAPVPAERGGKRQGDGAKADRG